MIFIIKKLVKWKYLIQFFFITFWLFCQQYRIEFLSLSYGMVFFAQNRFFCSLILYKLHKNMFYISFVTEWVKFYVNYSWLEPDWLHCFWMHVLDLLHLEIGNLQGWVQDFPDGVLTTKATATYYLVKVSWKLHKNEENWTQGLHSFKILICRSDTVLARWTGLFRLCWKYRPKPGTIFQHICHKSPVNIISYFNSIEIDVRALKERGLAPR